MRIAERSVLALFGVMMAAGCSSPAAPTGGGNAAAGGTVTINIMGVNGKQSFSPNPADVPTGQMVIFRNTDQVTHRVVLDDGSIDSGDIAPGATSQPVALGGLSKPYHCSMHPSMVGSLNAAATPEPPPCTGYCG